jgi:hypothetical protein
MGEECQDQLREVLRRELNLKFYTWWSFSLDIDSNNLLPPLMVIRMLQKNPKTPLGIVKDYLSRKLQEDNSLIEAVIDSSLAFWLLILWVSMRWRFNNFKKKLFIWRTKSRI